MCIRDSFECVHVGRNLAATVLYFCTENAWPRLQSSLEKPHWISVDFDRFEYVDDSEEEEDEESNEVDPEKMKRMVCALIRGMK